MLLAALSSGARLAGKTGLLSQIAANTLREDGYLHRPGGETILIAASSFAQAAIGADPIRVILDCDKGGENADLYRCVRQSEFARHSKQKIQSDLEVHRKRFQKVAWA